jgi:hypothetical protein
MFRDEYIENPYWVVKIRGNPSDIKYSNLKLVRENSGVVKAEISINQKNYTINI